MLQWQFVGMCAQCWRHNRDLALTRTELGLLVLLCYECLEGVEVEYCDCDAEDPGYSCPEYY